MKSLDFINKVFHEDARGLLAALPADGIDSVISDPMFGVLKTPQPGSTYDWGVDPAGGDPDKWWAYHRPLYEECRRVLRPGGTLAWAMGCKFHRHFPEWFGGYRIWSLTRFTHRGLNAFGHVWVAQTKEQTPIRFPDKDSLIHLDTRTRPTLLKLHPCPKAVEEMLFLVQALTAPGQVVLDPFCGTGSTLVAAALSGRKFIGCDLSERYCRVAKKRLADLNLLGAGADGNRESPDVRLGRFPGAVGGTPPAGVNPDTPE
jgi:DNA modification methylase